MRFGVLALSFLSAACVQSGEFNQTLKIGDPAPAWKSLPGVDGKKHSLADLKARKFVVVVFTCNSCPVAVDYEDRIIAFAKKYAPDVAVVAINVNKVPADSLDKMKERSEQKKLPYPYLFDESQQIAKKFGAVFTPEFFVLDSDRRVVYMGGMDDNSNPKLVKETNLEPALVALLKGDKPPKSETLARGCRIRYAKERK